MLITVGQRNYFTTSVTLLYQLPLLAVLFITGNNNVRKLGGAISEITPDITSEITSEIISEVMLKWPFGDDFSDHFRDDL